LSLTAVGLQYVSGAAVLSFLGLGAPLLAIAAASGFYVLRQWKKSIDGRGERIRDLERRIGATHRAKAGE